MDANILKSSGYIARMSAADLSARGLSIGQNILGIYIDRYRPLLPNELESQKQDNLALSKIFQKMWPRASSVNFQVCAFSGLENEFPHTHGTIVCLPSWHFEKPAALRLKTLAHEFVHVYQRLFPIDVSTCLTHWGYKPLGLRSSLNKGLLARLNPDINDIVYIGPSGDVRILAYTSPFPSSLTDTRTVLLNTALQPIGLFPPDAQVEHPFEHMAYVAADILTGSSPTVESAIVRAWMQHKNTSPVYG